MQKIKVKFWVYTANAGDGSCSLFFFKTAEAAEKYAEKDNERNCEDITEEYLLVDQDGNLIIDDSYGVKYDPNFGDDEKCVNCKHPYERHFNLHDGDTETVSCKYCACDDFYSFRR